MEEKIAARLPVEERVCRYTIQSWLSTRLKKQKEMSNPKFVRKQAVARERSRLFMEAWGLDTSTMTQKDIVAKLEQLKFKRRSKGRAKGRTGDFTASASKKILLAFLHSKLSVPHPFTDVDAFIKDVEARSKKV